MAIKYVTERVTVNSTQLAAWSAWTSANTMNLAGPCPVCGHDAPNSVPLQVSALEGGAVPASHALTVALKCTCEQPHQGRPADVPIGCGRNWSATALTAADDAVTLSPLADPMLEAAAEALRTAASTQMAGLRAAAEKWIGGVTALYALFGLAGITITGNTVNSLDTTWQAGIAVSAVLAVALAGLAVYWTYRAAYGWPATRPVRDDDELRDWYAAQQAAPSVQAGLLKSGVRAAAASLAVLLLTVGLLRFAPQQVTPASPVQVTLSDGSQVCGRPMPTAAKGTLRFRRASDGTVLPIPLSEIVGLTAVAGCLPGELHVRHASPGQVTANGGDGHRRVVLRLVLRVEVRISGVMHGNELKPRVQARRARRARPRVDLVTQPSRVRVQAVRSPEGQLKRRVMRVLQDKQRMSRGHPVQADPPDPAARRRLRQAVGTPDRPTSGRITDSQQGEIELIGGGQPTTRVSEAINGARGAPRHQPVIREPEHRPCIDDRAVIGPLIVETQPRLSRICHLVGKHPDHVEVREAQIGPYEKPGAHRRSQSGRNLDTAYMSLELAELRAPRADVHERH